MATAVTWCDAFPGSIWWLVTRLCYSAILGLGIASSDRAWPRGLRDGETGSVCDGCWVGQ